MIARQASVTKRYHTIPTIGEQSVAEHSYHVAMICLEITKGKASANLLKAALYHDLPEHVTGDVPAPCKWANCDIKNALERVEEDFILAHGFEVNLTEQEKQILKLADILELCYYCHDQVMLGNRNMLEIFERGMKYMATLPVEVGDFDFTVVENILEKYNNECKR